MIDRNDLTLHDDLEHIIAQFRHGCGCAAKGTAVDEINRHIGLLIRRLTCRRSLHRGHLLEGLLPDALRFLKQSSSVHGTMGLQQNLRRDTKPAMQAVFEVNQMLLQLIFSVCNQMYGNLLRGDLPFGAGQNGPCRSMNTAQHIHQIPWFHLRHCLRRKAPFRLQLLQAVNTLQQCKGTADLLPAQIRRAVKTQRYPTFTGIQIRASQLHRLPSIQFRFLRSVL